MFTLAAGYSHIYSRKVVGIPIRKRSMLTSCTPFESSADSHLSVEVRTEIQASDLARIRTVRS